MYIYIYIYAYAYEYTYIEGGNWAHFEKTQKISFNNILQS